MARPPLLVSPADGSAQRLRRSRQDDFCRRLLALMSAYGVDFTDSDRWYRLCVELAMRHVPGFSYETRGAAPEIDPGKVEALFFEVERARWALARGKRGKRTRPHSVARACAILSKDDGSPFFGHNPEQLRQTYSRYGLSRAGRRKKSRRLAMWSPDRQGIVAPGTADAADKIMRRYIGRELAKKDRKEAERFAAIASRLIPE